MRRIVSAVTLIFPCSILARFVGFHTDGLRERDLRHSQGLTGLPHMFAEGEKEDLGAFVELAGHTKEVGPCRTRLNGIIIPPLPMANPNGGRTRNGPVRAGVTINIEIPRELHRRVSITAAALEVSLKDAFIEGAQHWVARHAAAVAEATCRLDVLPDSAANEKR